MYVSLDSGMHVFFYVAKADAWEGQCVQSNYELIENKQHITLDNSIILLYAVCIRRGHMKIIINHSSMQPIYEQITDQIKAMIIDGTLKEEEMLPSVRTLAKELKISALTV